MYIDPVLYHGRPADADSRAPREKRCYDALDMLGIAYDRADHDRADTIEDCLGIEKVLNAPIVKNLFLCNRQKTDFYLLIMPGDKPFKTKYLSAQINSARLSFGDAEDMEKYLDVHPGSASVLGVMNDKSGSVRLLIDRDVEKFEFIGCHPCENTSTLKISLEDIMKKFLPSAGHEPIFVDLPSEFE